MIEDRTSEAPSGRVRDRDRIERHLRIQYEAARILAGAGSLAEATRALVERLCRGIDWDIGGCWEVNGSRLVCTATWCEEASPLEPFARASEEQIFAPGEGLPGRVWESGEPAWIEDLRLDANFPRSAIAERCGLRTGLAFPITLGGNVLGVIETFSRIRVPRDDATLEMFAALGAQVGQFIERRRAEEELRRRERELTDFLENAAIGMHWVDADGIIIWANRAEMEMLGYLPEEYIGRPIADFHTDAGVIEDILRRLRAGEELHGYEARLRCKDGSIRDVMISSNVRREDGRFVHTRCFTRDITQRKAVEEALRRSNDALRDLTARLREANDAKDEFLGMISHELRTPITTIRGNATVLRKRFDDMPTEDRDAALRDIEQESQRLQRMIDNLLALARVETGRRIEPEPVLLHREVRRLAEEHEQQHVWRRVIVRAEPELDPVAAEPAYVEHVLRNLLGNAEKYSPPHEPVEIAVSRHTCGVAVAVLDRGAGIDDEEAERLFQPFYRSPRTASAASGAGLGLAVCKRLVEAQGGAIWARSRPGGGADVGFILPEWPRASTVEI